MLQHGHLIKIKNVTNNNYIYNLIIVKVEKDDPLTTPDPGKYNIIDNSGKTPSWQIGKAKRECVKIDSKTPGSGKYEYQTFIGEGPKYSFRPKFDENGLNTEKRNRNAYQKTKVPGPGHYDPIDNTGGPKYTIGLRHYKKKIKGLFKLNVPGAGSYEITKDFEAPCFRMDKEKRKDLSLNHTALQYPGPDKYTYNTEGEATTTPKWTFSKCERFKRQKPKSAFVRKIEVPGPGSYKTQTFLGKEGPHYTFNKDKFNHADAVDEAMFKKRKNYPAPGTYGTDKPYYSDTPKYSISQLKRNQVGSDKYMLTTPGPEKYNPDKYVSSTIKKAPIWTLGKENKDENEKVKGSKKVRVQTPGPGHYHNLIGNIPNGPHFSMAKKLKKRKKEEKPGPGKYEIVTVHFPSEPKFSFGKEVRKDDRVLQLIKEGFPGPNKYTITDSNFNNVGHFTKDKRYKSSSFVTPGPGHYRIPTAFDYISDYTRQKGQFNPIFKYV